MKDEDVGEEGRVWFGGGGRGRLYGEGGFRVGLGGEYGRFFFVKKLIKSKFRGIERWKDLNLLGNREGWLWFICSC